MCGGSYPPPGQAGCVPSSLDAPSSLLPLLETFPRVSDLTQAAGGREEESGARTICIKLQPPDWGAQSLP